MDITDIMRTNTTHTRIIGIANTTHTMGTIGINNTTHTIMGLIIGIITIHTIITEIVIMENDIIKINIIKGKGKGKEIIKKINVRG